MSASLRALLNDTIDYAGIFPPASLSLGEASARYWRYQNVAESWMMARFVCPAGRLGELKLPGDFPWRIAAVGRSAESAEQFLIALREDLLAIAALQATLGEQVRIELLETPLPKQIRECSSDSEIRSFVAAVADQLGRPRLDISAALFEAVLSGEWEQRLPIIAAALGAANQILRDKLNAPRCGLKLRTGGAATLPTAEQVALVISTCRDAEIPWKATAGLHQPLRHVDAATGTTAHGFVNLITATVMASVHRLSPAQIKEIVNDQVAANFAFRDAAFSWQDWRATTEQIRRVREESFVSFGSCSFEEPRECLRDLGWL